jgi:hypothetical protein
MWLLNIVNLVEQSLQHHQFLPPLGEVGPMREARVDLNGSQLHGNNNDQGENGFGTCNWLLKFYVACLGRCLLGVVFPQSGFYPRQRSAMALVSRPDEHKARKVAWFGGAITIELPAAFSDIR